MDAVIINVTNKVKKTNCQNRLDCFMSSKEKKNSRLKSCARNSSFIKITDYSTGLSPPSPAKTGHPEDGKHYCCYQI